MKEYAKKSLGQNFIKDSNIINKIINLIEIKDKDILEIGPGTGKLTEKILKKKPRSLILIEKDNFLSAKLKFKYKENKKVKIFNDDILKINFEKKVKKGTVIFGNLPYNIASQILVKVIKFKNWPPIYSALIFMFQKEVADRIVGKFGTKKYGRLSILSNYKLIIIDKFNVSPNSFYPKPKVNSTVLFFKPKKKINIKIKNLQNLENITNFFFSSKRKMINKTIKNKFNKKIQKELIKDLNTQARPSDLRPEKYYQITELFEKYL